MGMLLRCFKNDMRRAVLNMGTLSAVILTFLIQLQATFEELLSPGGDIIYYFKLTLDTGMMQILMPAVGTLCYAWVIDSDRATGFSVLERTRADHIRYLISKMCACWVSAFLAVAVGMLLFCLMLAFQMPIISDVGSVNIDSYSYFLFGDCIAHGQYIAYLSLMILTRSLAAGAWASVGMAISLVSCERYVIHFAPFLIAYFIDIALLRLGITITPLRLDVGNVPGTQGMTLVLGVFGGITLLSVIAIMGIEWRRIHHGDA